MTIVVLEILCWCSLSVLAYTFVGFPLGVAFVGRSFSRPVRKAAPPIPPTVSAIVVMRNEAARAAGRVSNLMETSYPADKLEVFVVSDGSDDGTADVVRALSAAADAGTVIVLEQPERVGKPAGLNLAAARARGEILVFADARQRFTLKTIPELVANFSDPEVGAASGELHIAMTADGVGAGVDAYWRLEKAIRLGESRLGSAIGCTGAVYAVRRDLFRPLPADTILDDVLVPMGVLAQGRRVVFDPAAKAFDPQALSPANESRRKRRTLAGNFQLLFRYPSWLVPGKLPGWGTCFYLSHKVLRLVAPVFLALALATTAVLAAGDSGMVYRVLLAAQTGLYCLAVAGICGGNRLAGRLFAWPAGFLFLNAMTVLGFVSYLRSRGRGLW